MVSHALRLSPTLQLVQDQECRSPSGTWCRCVLPRCQRLTLMLIASCRPRTVLPSVAAVRAANGVHADVDAIWWVPTCRRKRPFSFLLSEPSALESPLRGLPLHTWPVAGRALMNRSICALHCCHIGGMRAHQCFRDHWQFATLCRTVAQRRGGLEDASTACVG